MLYSETYDTLWWVSLFPGAHRWGTSGTTRRRTLPSGASVWWSALTQQGWCRSDDHFLTRSKCPVFLEIEINTWSLFRTSSSSAMLWLHGSVLRTTWETCFTRWVVHQKHGLTEAFHTLWWSTFRHSKTDLTVWTMFRSERCGYLFSFISTSRHKIKCVGVFTVKGCKFDAKYFCFLRFCTASRTRLEKKTGISFPSSSPLFWRSACQPAMASNLKPSCGPLTC